MAPLIYFIPKLGAMKKEKFAEFGLEYIAPNPQEGPQQCKCHQGPEEQEGVLFGFPDINNRINLQGIASQATWTKMTDKEVWVGFSEQDKPAPEDLARPLMHMSNPVKFADDNMWQVPILRIGGTDDECYFKKELTKEGSQWVKGRVTKEYAEIFRRACQAWDEFILEEEDVTEGTEMNISGAWDLAIDALALNYRISSDEISALGLWDTEIGTAVFLACIDWPRWLSYIRNLEKKNGEHMNLT